MDAKPKVIEVFDTLFKRHGNCWCLLSSEKETIEQNISKRGYKVRVCIGEE